ncbi:MAG: hypothetical protein DRI44_00055 [Chlamydiae bacterium]|nr:MAG: hypothetical protein DRI44_00055 [Chlamydiota bacterium]
MKVIYLIIILLFAGCVSFNKKTAVDEQVFIAVRDAVDNIQYQRTVSGFEYSVTPYKGEIKTEWFRTHKGEVKLRVTCKVEGTNYYVTVIQRGFFRNSENTYSAKIFKEKLIKEIKNNLSTVKENEK